MVDPISLVIAISAVVMAILSNIRKSKCYGVEIETRNNRDESESGETIEEVEQVEANDQHANKVYNFS